MPASMEYGAVLAHVRALPSAARPEVFGLHDNADITKDNNEAAAVAYQYLCNLIPLRTGTYHHPAYVCRQGRDSRYITELI